MRPYVLKRVAYVLRWVSIGGPPFLFFLVALTLWQVGVVFSGIPDYLLPTPSDIWAVMVEKKVELFSSVKTTFLPTILGYLLSIVVGGAIALIMSLSKVLERSIYPYAIVLQTIPVVAIAPLIVIWFRAGMNAIVIISFIIAVFPMISNTVLGLTSTDNNLINLMKMYNASGFQMMFNLKVPFAMPYIMGGMKISGGLAVIGAIVGEFIAGMGGGEGGLGYAITSAALHLQIPYLFANALAASVLGISIFIAVNLLSSLVLGHWHESSTKSEN